MVESTSNDIFLREVRLVTKFLTENMDKDKSLSEEEQQVQTFRRSGRYPKARIKSNNKTSKTINLSKSNSVHHYHRFFLWMFYANRDHITNAFNHCSLLYLGVMF